MNSEDLHNRLVAYYFWSRKNSRRPTKKLKGVKRRFWVRPIFLMRNQLGARNTLVREMRIHPDNRHCNFLRMTSTTFDKLLSLIGPRIIKSDLGREPIDPTTRLTMSLRFLASGDSINSISYLFRVGVSTTSKAISETLDVIWTVLQPLILKPPTEEDWRKSAQGFERRWNFPNCIGAVDGKHVSIQAPPHAGSTYYNYKGGHSLALLAVVGSDYRFLLVDIGAQGRQSDGGIFRASVFGKKLLSKSLNIPPTSIISDGRPLLPHVIVGDEAFPLLENLMRPYPGKSDLSIEERIYNYRHSRARRISENCFGILSSRWRIFSKPIIGKIENIENIIKATVCLHNFLIDNESSYITPTLIDNEREGKIIAGAWREVSSQLLPLRNTGSNMYNITLREVRNAFKEYFNEEGSVPWQWNVF